MPHAFLMSPEIFVHQFCAKAVLPEKMARRQAKRMNDTPGVQHGHGTARAYRCPICGQWHVGHLLSGNEKRKV